MDKLELTNNIKKLSYDLGFDIIGVSSSNIDNNQSNQYFEKWLSLGHHASMKWIENKKEERKSILKYFPDVKSVLSFGFNYYSGSNCSSENYKISNYAWGDDYHIIIKEKLYEILSFIKSCNENIDYRVCVDTSPVIEKAWAQRAGLGWIGKHTNILTRDYSSWLFLGVLIINQELEYDKLYQDDKLIIFDPMGNGKYIIDNGKELVTKELTTSLLIQFLLDIKCQHTFECSTEK